MSVTISLLKLIKNKAEILKSMQEINSTVARTFEECCEFSFNQNFNYDESYFFKIDSVVDFLHDELNTGHWSEVSVSLRRAFTSASFIKATIILKNTSLNDALKAIDRGLLLGAPLSDNAELLTQSASILSRHLNEALGERVKDNKRKCCDAHRDVYDALKGEQILTLKCPSMETFNNKCFLPKMPVKLQDCITHWPACTKWLDVNYLLEVAGNRTVPIEIGSHYADENWSQKLMSLREFIQNHYLGSADAIGYLAQHNLFDQITELKDDIRIPEYCALSRNYDESVEPDINAWFGPQGTVSPLHFDPKDNLLTQVYGSKQVLLYSPLDSEFLYAHDDKLLFNTAQVDPIDVDLSKYPKYSKATPFKCLLEAGEILYIPEKWWHHVTALDKSFSVSFWWQ